jgi:beta-lactam-binding protein with PASTA domain
MNGSRLGALLVLASVLALTAGCAQAKPQRVPDVSGDRLDLAEATLEADGLSYEIYGGGKLGVIDDSQWSVCSQQPQEGRKATKVELVVARSCPQAATTPHVVGLNLHEARETLEASGINVDVYTYDEYYGDDDDDSDAIVVERNWRVCKQIDTSSANWQEAELIVDHDCP